jgi:hypothetical protein
VRRRVLIVVSSYRPAMLADMQRARALAWELPALGWDVEILTPAACEVRQDAIEPDGDGFFANGTPVHEVRAWLAPLFRLLGLGSGAWRMWLPMYRRGRALLASRRFDLVYFSTTAFNFFFFGPLWWARSGVPYVLDFHDPWVLPAQRYRGAGWKARLSAWLDPSLEKKAVCDAAGLIAVSDAYIAALKQRYQRQAPLWLKPHRHATIPFSAEERDLVEARRGRDSAAAAGVVRSAGTATKTGELTLHYVGDGPSRRRSFALICQALAHLRACVDSTLASRVRIRLFGTGEPVTHVSDTVLKPAADAAGIADLVEEWPQRVPYRRALELMLESSALLVLGADDSGYVPSKLFGYALSGRPLLACLRRDGPAYALFRSEPRLGRALWFDQKHEMPLDEAASVVREFLHEVAAGMTFDRRSFLQAHLSPAMARRHVELFQACLGGGASR